MRQFYTATQKIYDLLNADSNIHTITISTDINDVDLSKTSIYPLAHILVGDVNLNGSTFTMNFTVICMDIVDFNKNTLRDESNVFYGTTDVQDIWNTQLQVCNRLVENLRRGDAFDTLFQLSGSVNATPFKDRFENLLAGCAVDIAITVPNTEICV